MNIFHTLNVWTQQQLFMLLHIADMAADPVVNGDLWRNGDHIKAYSDDVVRNLSYVPSVVRKTADETVNNSTTLQNDDDLKLAVSANQVWALRFLLLFNSSATADFKTNLTAPAGSTIHGRYVGFVAGGSFTEDQGAAADMSGQGADWLIELNFIVIVSTTAGDVQLQWAQNTLEATDTKVLANSTLIAIQVA